MIKHAVREIIYYLTIYKLPFSGLINDDVNVNNNDNRLRILNSEL